MYTEENPNEIAGLDSDDEIAGLDSDEENSIDQDSDIENDEQIKVAYLASCEYPYAQSPNYTDEINFQPNFGLYKVDLKTLCRCSDLVKNVNENDTTHNGLFIIKNGSNVCMDETVKKIAEWVEYHTDGTVSHMLSEQPVKHSKYNKILKDKGVDDKNIEWYVNYMNIKHNILFDLINSCNYMGMIDNKDLNQGGLLNYCCAKLATIIKGRSPDQLRKILNAEV